MTPSSRASLASFCWLQLVETNKVSRCFPKQQEKDKDKDKKKTMTKTRKSQEKLQLHEIPLGYQSKGSHAKNCMYPPEHNECSYISMIMRYWFEYIKRSEKNYDGDDDGCTMVLI